MCSVINVKNVHEVWLSPQREIKTNLNDSPTTTTSGSSEEADERCDQAVFFSPLSQFSNGTTSPSLSARTVYQSLSDDDQEDRFLCKSDESDNSSLCSEATVSTKNEQSEQWKSYQSRLVDIESAYEAKLQAAYEENARYREENANLKRCIAILRTEKKYTEDELKRVQKDREKATGRCKRLTSSVASITVEVNKWRLSAKRETAYHHVLNYMGKMLHTFDFKSQQSIARCVDALQASLGHSVVEQHTVNEIYRLCVAVNASDWEELFCTFLKVLSNTQKARNSMHSMRDRALGETWHLEPWYYVNVRKFNSPDGMRGTFESLMNAMPYLEHLGFRNILLLPHYESTNKDGGYDVTDFSPAAELGGSASYQNMLAAAHRSNIRVVTEGIFTQVSTMHKWFRKALSGENIAGEYFCRADGAKKVKEGLNHMGMVTISYEMPDGRVIDKECLMPEICRSHLMEVTGTNGRKMVFTQHGNPYCADMNLANPLYFREVLQILGAEFNQGILGKRIVGSDHLVKDGLFVDTGKSSAMMSLLNIFVKVLTAGRGVLIADPIADTATALARSGVIDATRAKISRPALTFAHETQATVYAASCLSDATPLWELINKAKKLPASVLESGAWMNMSENFDGCFVGLLDDTRKKGMEGRDGSIVHQNGTVMSGRLATILGGDERRLSAAIFCNYILPGTPVMYNGTELGVGSKYIPSRDPRDLQRGPIDEKALQDGWNGSRSTCELVRHLNRARRLYTAVTSPNIIPVETCLGDSAVFAAIKQPRAVDPGSTFVTSESQEPVLCMVNLSDKAKSVSALLNVFESRMGIKSGQEFCLLDAKGAQKREFRSVTVQRRENRVIFSLQPYECILAVKVVSTRSNTAEV